MIDWLKFTAWTLGIGLGTWLPIPFIFPQWGTPVAVIRNIMLFAFGFVVASRARTRENLVSERRPEK